MLDPGAPARLDLAELKGQHCFLGKLTVPLLRQAGRSNDQHALCPTGQHQTADRKGRLDRFTQADLVAHHVGIGPALNKPPADDLLMRPRRDRSRIHAQINTAGHLWRVPQHSKLQHFFRRGLDIDGQHGPVDLCWPPAQILQPDQTRLDGFRDRHHLHVRIPVFPQIQKTLLCVLHTGAIAPTRPVTMDVDVFRVFHQRGFRFVQRSASVQPMPIVIAHNKPFFMDIAIFDGVHADRLAGPGIHPEGNAHLQLAGSNHLAEQRNTVLYLFRPVFRFFEFIHQPVGEPLLVPSKDRGNILKLKVGAYDQAHLPFVLQEGGISLRCRGQRRGAKVPGDPIVLGDSCQSGEIEVMQNICWLSRRIHAGRAVTILPFMTGQILRHGSFTSLRSNRTGFFLPLWSALRCRNHLPRREVRQRLYPRVRKPVAADRRGLPGYRLPDMP